MLSRAMKTKTSFKILLCLPLLLAALAGCSARREVVVYTSQDEVYADPIFKEFTKRTGVPVRAVYDSEAVKTVGMANRLMAERVHPACDLFWNNEEFRTRLLAAEGIFDATEGWVPLGHRSRRIVVNTDLVKIMHYPRSPEELTNSFWRGHVAIAYPMFGTTSTYFLALRQALREPRWLAWCTTLMANKPLLVDGNSVVVKFVTSGQAWVGLTDSDDIQAAQKEGAPLKALDLNRASLLIHNTLGLIAQAPHPAEARQLMEFLRSPEVARELMATGALEGMEDGNDASYTLKVDWEAMLRDVEPATATMQSIFLRSQ
jgi:iron(III) transport system substrate-binding protein